jgi:glycosyltransferase involved in cell wall biosynthesis
MKRYFGNASGGGPREPIESRCRLKRGDMTADHNRKKIAVVIPVFNDWEAFAQLLAQLGEQAELEKNDLYVFAIDDGSSELADMAALSVSKGTLSDLRVIHLACNLGHQRAIAVGMVAVNKAGDMDATVVMDSDGEDRPDAVVKLIAAWDKEPGKIVVARRGRRSERLTFRVFYSIYKLVFRILTGQPISFGNFCLVPRHALKALVHSPAIWNNLSAAIARSHIPYTEIQINRAPRLAGRSRMSFVSLAIHGLSAVSVYTDIVLVRIILAACILGGIVILALIAVISVKFGTDWAIPGWASYVAVSLTIIFIQVILLAGVALFQLLSFRSLKPFIPASDATSFVLDASKDFDRGRFGKTDHDTEAERGKAAYRGEVRAFTSPPKE